MNITLFELEKHDLSCTFYLSILSIRIGDNYRGLVNICIESDLKFIDLMFIRFHA